MSLTFQPGYRKPPEDDVSAREFAVSPGRSSPAGWTLEILADGVSAISQGIWLKLRQFLLFPCRPVANFLEIGCASVEPNMAGRGMDRIRIDRLLARPPAGDDPSSGGDVS